MPSPQDVTNQVRFTVSVNMLVETVTSFCSPDSPENIICLYDKPQQTQIRVYYTCRFCPNISRPLPRGISIYARRLTHSKC